MRTGREHTEPWGERCLGTPTREETQVVIIRAVAERDHVTLGKASGAKKASDFDATSLSALTRRR